MHEFDTRQTKPPEGGIFLCPEMVMPSKVEELIQVLPELHEISSRAKQQLAAEMEHVHQKYQTSLLSHNEIGLSPASVYGRLVRSSIEKGWTGKTANSAAIADIGRVENLKSESALFEDARSTICSFGEQMVEVLKPQLLPGTHMIGDHQYEVLEGRFGGAKHFWLCGFDDVDSLWVYYNRWDKIREPMSRAAFLNDYVQLMRDVVMEQAK